MGIYRKFVIHMLQKSAKPYKYWAERVTYKFSKICYICILEGFYHGKEKIYKK
jgi:hypothetical protein